MNPISAFFVRHIVVVFFVYGLAFFAMGLALLLASRRTSEFRFARAIRPLAIFGLAHGVHEWIEMFQKIAALTSGYTPTVSQEIIRMAILAASFTMLSAFGIRLLSPLKSGRRRAPVFVFGMVGLWLLSVMIVGVAFQPSTEELLALADVLARYGLGIPGAFLGAWALMVQQRTFREHGMPQFGRDLIWCATALILYGIIGQLFVRPTSLVPSNVINSTLFLQWFGIPVQLFRGVMATVLAVFMVRALNAFELENTRRLEAINQAKLQVQTAALEAERRVSREMERLNEELRLTTQELGLLLNLSNLLATPMSLHDRLHNVLDKIVHSLDFPDAGMILLIRSQTGVLDMRTSTGFRDEAQCAWGHDLGQACVAKAKVVCGHQDGQIFEFLPDEAAAKHECRSYPSPLTMLSLPLTVKGQVIGSIVLGHTRTEGAATPSHDEFNLMLGIAQQLGLSIENVRLYQEAQEREKLLGNLLHQVVGAQEAERQRIAREMHDATGQSLTAIALGLRGVETMLDADPSIASRQVAELRSFTTEALGELHQLIVDLRPSQLDDLGLVAALHWYTREFEKRYAIQTEFVVKGNRVRLPSEYETVLFRIAQEALTNIAKHARASHVVVSLEIQPTRIWASIQDDGRGFDTAQVFRRDNLHTGWGLLGIQERAALLGGQYEIESEPGRGTCVRVQVPLMVEKQDVQDSAAVG